MAGLIAYLKNLSAREWLLLAFNATYIVAFTTYYVLSENYEFLWYVVVLVFFFSLLIGTLRKVEFSQPILWGLSIWGLLHMAGGGIKVGDEVLYAYLLVPLVDQGELLILKYDQFVHAFGFGVATLVARHVIDRYLLPQRKHFMYFMLLVLAGTGLGVLNEIVEFIAVIAISETGVGGYYNTALDLVFNTLGATLAALGVYFYSRRQASLPIERPIVNV